MIELEITEEDRQKAKAERAEGGWMTQCCLIFQAAKRTGLHPESVQCTYMRTRIGQRYYFDSKAHAVAFLDPAEWDDIKLPRKVGLELCLESHTSSVG